MNHEHEDAGAIARAAHARATFERAVEAMPVATANRLRLARRAALASAPGARSGRDLLHWVVPVGATAALLVGIGWWRQASAPAPVAPAPVVVAAAGSPVAIAALPSEDDVDLYAFLAEAPVASDARGGGSL